MKQNQDSLHGNETTDCNCIHQEDYDNIQGRVNHDEEKEENDVIRTSAFQHVDDAAIVLTMNNDGAVGLNHIINHNIFRDVENQNNNHDNQLNQPLPSLSEAAGVVDDRTEQNSKVINPNLNLNEMMDERLRVLEIERVHHLSVDQEQSRQQTSTNETRGSSKKQNYCHCNRQYVNYLSLVCIFISGVAIGLLIISLSNDNNESPSPTTTVPVITLTPTTSLSSIFTTTQPAQNTSTPTTPKPTNPKPTFPPLTKTTWIQVGNDIDGLNRGDEAGSSVSMSKLGDMVVVGSPTYWGLGSAQVYKFNNNKWNLIDTLLSGNSATDINEGFGEAVSISNDGEVIVIGAKYTGTVYIYNFNTITNTIELVQELTGDDTKDYFGTSVDVSGDGSTIVVGSISDDYVKVYRKDDSNSNNSNWSQIGNKLTMRSNYDKFGSSVSISNDGNVVAVSRPYSLNGNVKMYQYIKSSNEWIDYGYNVLDGDRHDNQFGSSISLSSSGNIVAIGEPNNDRIYNSRKRRGTVKIFKLSSDSNPYWYQLGSNIDGEHEDDRSGEYQSVKLSNNGMIVAIGSALNDDNGSNSGSVRIFEYDLDNSEWIQISQDIDGEEEYDYSGRSISLSGDGSIVAIGAWRNDGNDDEGNDYTEPGHVRVYRRGDA